MTKSVQLAILVLATTLAVGACKPSDSGAGSSTSAGAAQSSSHSNAVPSVPGANDQTDTAKKAK